MISNERGLLVTWTNQSHADLRAWKISSVFGVEAPAERDFTAAMQCVEDGER